MFCGSCGTENTTEAKFCKNCGRPLSKGKTGEDVTKTAGKGRKGLSKGIEEMYTGTKSKLEYNYSYDASDNFKDYCNK